MKKWLKITLIIVAVFVFLLTVLFSLASPVAKSYVNKHGKDLIGREIHVDKLKINALFGRVRIYDMTVYEEDDETAFFSFDTLDVSVKLRKLLFNSLHVRHIVLAHPVVHVIQNADHFNFSSIIDHFASDEEDKDDDTTSSNWKLGFYNIRLSNGEIFYSDKKLGSDWNLKNLNLRVPGVYFDGSENTDAGLALQLADGGVLRTEASMNMDNNEFSVDLELEDFALSNVKSYLGDVMNVERLDGTLDADIVVKGNLSDIMKMNISGTAKMDGVGVVDNSKSPILQFDNLTVDVNRINLHDNLYDVKAVILDGLVARYDIFAEGSNLSRLFSTPNKDVEEELPELESNADTVSTSGESQDASSSKPLKLSVGTLAVRDAQFTVNDYSLPDDFSFPVKKLNISAENVSMNGENKARVTAQLPHGGMAVINWRGVLDDWKKSQRLMLSIRNLQLKDFSPYAVAYLGHPFTDGTVSFVSENTINFSQLNGRNELDLYNPEVGDKRKDVDAKVNVPLKAALYILKDKDGKVQFEVPVTGNIDSPEFSYMKIVWKTLGNLIVKVATSPFRAVSKALGMSGELDYVVFDPLQTQFTSEQYSILNKIADVLRYDTNIVVTLVPQINTETEWKKQSLYLLKEEYFLSQHPDIANSRTLPQTFIYDKVSAISTKDTGFVSFLKNKGLTSKKPSDKEIQRLAERLYPKDAAVSSLAVVAGFRDDKVRNFFYEQNNIPQSQLIVGEMETAVTKSGYMINSDVRNAGDGDFGDE